MSPLILIKHTHAYSLSYIPVPTHLPSIPYMFGVSFGLEKVISSFRQGCADAVFSNELSAFFRILEALQAAYSVLVLLIKHCSMLLTS